MTSLGVLEHNPAVDHCPGTKNTTINALITRCHTRKHFGNFASRENKKKPQMKTKENEVILGELTEDGLYLTTEAFSFTPQCDFLSSSVHRTPMF